jgi:hypothetical protein
MVNTTAKHKILYQRNVQRLKMLEQQKQNIQNRKQEIEKQMDFLEKLYAAREVTGLDDLDFRLHMLAKRVNLNEDRVYNLLKRIQDGRYSPIMKEWKKSVSLLQRTQYDYAQNFMAKLLKDNFKNRKITSPQYDRFFKYVSEIQAVENETNFFLQTRWFKLEHANLFSTRENCNVYLPVSDKLSKEALKNSERTGEFEYLLGDDYLIRGSYGGDGPETPDFHFGTKGRVNNLLYRCYSKPLRNLSREREVEAAVYLSPEEFFDYNKPHLLRINKGKLEFGGQNETQ